MSDDVWGSADEPGVAGSPEPAGGAGSEPAREGHLTAGATTVLTGFATGGIVGMLEALEANTWASPDPDVEDPEALARAEAQVARVDRPGRAAAPIDEQWVPVARQVGEALIGGLQDVAMALTASSVPFGWDPFDPREAPSFTPPIMGTRGRTFAIVVPASEAAKAREALEGLRAEGVTFAWDEAGGPVATQSAPTSPEDEYGFGPSTSADAPDSYDAAGRPLSDNARLERMGAGGPSGFAIVLAIVAGLLVIGVAAYLVLRG